MTTPFRLGEDTLNPAHLAALAAGTLPVTLSPDRLALLEARHASLVAAIDGGMQVYGSTTGFGPLADRTVAGQADGLQRGLVAHLASGTGPLLHPDEARAVALARAHVLALGESGVRAGWLQGVLPILAAGLAPGIPSLGSVGASGDLTPLAHAALAFGGEGELHDGEGWRPAGEVLRRRGLAPVVPATRDGLAWVNGTSMTAALGALSAVELRRALDHAVVQAVAFAEVLGGRREAFDALPALRRGRAGQTVVARRLRRLSRGSRWLDPRPGSEGSAEGEAPQDAYSLRCAQQVLGAVLDGVDLLEREVTLELRSVTDNPVFRWQGDALAEVVHGGNFHGLPLALMLDHAHNVLVSLAVLVERRIHRLTHPRLNGGLPAFLSGGQVGKDSGFMGAQVTASALLAHLRVHATPASIQSVPTNADNQDVVPMAPAGAVRLRQSLPVLFDLLAIEALALAQAVALRPGPRSAISRSTRDLVARVRALSPPLAADRPLRPDIEAVALAWRRGE
jgi:tyrosine ammonia-lyase